MNKVVMDDVNYSIRRHNAPEGKRHPYTVEDIGNKIVENPVARNAYQRINNQGYDVRLNHDYDSAFGRTKNDVKNVEVFEMNNVNADQAVGTIVHKSTHVDYRYKKGVPYNTQYEEYRAAVRETLYHRSKDSDIQTRPTLEERRVIWEDTRRDYSYLEQGKYPFGGSRE
ncbi:MAG: hypothetical protein ACRC80_36490 [Waterburya sp.]